MDILRIIDRLKAEEGFSPVAYWDRTGRTGTKYPVALTDRLPGSPEVTIRRLVPN